MPGRTDWERHPADTARFVLATTIAMLSISVTRTIPDSVKGVSSDLVRLFDHLPNAVTTVIVGVLQITALAAPLLAIVWVRRGRWTEIALALGTSLVAAAVAALLNGWLEARRAAGDHPGR